MSDAHPTPGSGAPARPSLSRRSKLGSRGLRWGVVPVLIGGGLLAALLQGALLGGARDAVLRAAVEVGAGHLTIQPLASGGSAVGRGLIRDGGELYTNPALMRLTVPAGGRAGAEPSGRIAARLDLPVEIETQPPGGVAKRLAVELTGLEAPDDPQAALLSRFLVAGTWASDPASTDIAADFVLGAELAQQLGLSVGNTFGVRTGSGNTLRGVRGRVTGIVRTGLPRFDAGRLWAGAKVARELLPLPNEAREEAVSLLAIYLERPEQAVDWMTAVRRFTLPPGIEILTWRQVDPNALPWEPLITAQRRTLVAGLGVTAGSALVAAVLAAFAAAHRTRAFVLSARRVGSLAGPPLMGLTAGVLIYGLLWGIFQNTPLAASRAFTWFDPALNPYGALTGPVRLDLAVGQGLEWLGASLGVYIAISAGLAWLLSRRG